MSRFWLVAALLPSVAAAPLANQHSASGRTLLVDTGAIGKIELGPEFEYAGGHRFILREIADAEQHFFVDADGERRIRRLYWFQFESYLPSSAGQYDYSEDPSRSIAGLPFAVNVRRYAEEPAPDSDRAKAFGFLAARGFQLPRSADRVRLVYLPDASRRRELMIVYVEAAPPADASAAQETAGLIRRAVEGLRVISASTDQQPAAPGAAST